MRYGTALLVALMLLPACYFSQTSARRSVARGKGAWDWEKIEATDWPEPIKNRCKDREVIPGMTQEHVVAAFGNPDEKIVVNGLHVWIYNRYDLSAWDGTYIPQRSVRFDDKSLVLAVSTSG